jgi:hypothetical protein
MKVSNVQNEFINIIGFELEKKGFKYIKAKRRFELIQDNYKYICWLYFTKWESCIQINTDFGIGYIPSERIIKTTTSIINEYILGGNLKSISFFMQIPFDNNNKWDILYNENDVKLKSQEYLKYIETIITPFWEKSGDISFLYEYVKTTIFDRKILLPPNLENMLNIVSLAFFTKENLSEFEKIVLNCYQHPIFVNDIYKNKFYNLVNYIKNHY